MSLFLISFFFIYGGIHSYVFLKIWQAFSLKRPVGICIGLIFLVMIFAPIMVRLFEKGGHDSLARFTAYGGYTWMGIMFLFVSISISLDIFRFLVFFTGFILKMDFSALTSAHRFFFLISFIVASMIGFYGYREANNPRLETIRIFTNKIPKEAGKVTIAQISDVHVGLIVGEKKLKSISKLVKAINPDIFVSTGDLLDGDINSLNGLADILKEIQPKYGKFAITGNHEFYAGIKNSLAFTKRAGFTMLRGEGITIGEIINIAGVDDAAGKPFGYKGISERALLSKLPDSLFTILLKHKPNVDKDAQGLFDLQLSGHTHKGQIYPFRYLTQLFFPLYTGYYSLANNAHLYVSKGSGTWGPPIRFLAPPEVTAIELVYAP
jgi:predicted MPP superfamily phosphohydrolase